jgi:integrase
MPRFSLETGLRRANVTDLRHTWASWHVQAGTPLHVLQELGSWKCVEMVRKYAHLASDYLAPYVDRMSGLRLLQDGTLATFPATGGTQ